MILRLQSVTFLLALISSANGLQATDIPTDVPVSSLISSAKSHLASGSPRDAILYFDAAVSQDPSNYITIFQRGAAYLSIGRNAQASSDFDRVLELKPGFEGALLQRAKLKTKTADWTGAKRDLEASGDQGKKELEELEEAHAAAILAEKAEKQGDWEACVAQSGVAIMKASTALPLRQMRARCRFERGEVLEGVNDLAHVLHISPGSVEPHLQMSSMLFYSVADTERGLAQIRKCLHSDPDSKQCSRLYRREKQIAKELDNLQSLTESRKFSNMANILVGTKDESGLIEDVKEDVEEARKNGRIHPNSPNDLYTSLVEKACEVFREMNSLRKSEPYCTESLKLNPSSLHGLLFKANNLIESDEFDQAIHILNTAKEHHAGSNEVRTLLQKAQMLLKRSKQKDYYKVLGVDRRADERTIKRAYRQLTKQHHPDKAMGQGVTKEEAEKKMAAINEAYEVLSDQELRARFDRGDDPNSQEGQQGNPFQGSPFGFGPGGHQYYGGGGGRQFKFSGGGFPFG
ncbi:hypothetical protein FQN54_004264 [Arachnomyces sp. PD_36]|nr:hypothetical protein FQN54_004264 [Arachnomyces sp. PD_36]